MRRGSDLATQREETMSDNKQIIRDFIAAWSRLDADELAGFFTDDGTYYNMPLEPVSGRDNVREFISGFVSAWSATDWEVLNLVGDGDVVIAERVDRTKAGDKSVDLPCTGVFEMRDGKIAMWRDYFDMGTYAAAMT